MFVLFWRTIKDRRNSLLINSAIGIVLVWMFATIFPAFKDSAEDFEALATAYPEEILQVFGIENLGDMFASLENFIAVEHFSLVWPIILLVLVISWASSLIAGEIEKGSIELLLAQPLSRIKIFAAKYFSGVAALLIFIVSTVLLIIPVISLYVDDYRLANYFTMAILGFLFGMALFALTLFFSSVFSERGKAAFLAIGVVLAMYVMNVVALLKDSWELVKYGSFFYYFDYNEAMVNNNIEGLTYVVFIGVVLVFSLLAALAFVKRDIAS